MVAEILKHFLGKNLAKFHVHAEKARYTILSSENIIVNLYNIACNLEGE